MVDVTAVNWQIAEKHANPPRSNSQRRIAMQEKGRDVFVCFEAAEETRSQLGLRPNLKPVARTAGIGTISQLFSLQILREALKTSREGDSMVKTKS